MQFTQTLLLALIAWVSIGVYGSFYVIRSLVSPPARRRTHEEIYKTTHQEAYPEFDPPNTPEGGRIAVDVQHYDDQSPDVFEDIDVPQSPKELRLAALFICGLLGVVAVVVLAGLGWVGSMSIRRFVVRWLLTGGPDWVA